jgi:hypothetical protein
MRLGAPGSPVGRRGGRVRGLVRLRLRWFPPASLRGLRFSRPAFAMGAGCGLGRPVLFCAAGARWIAPRPRPTPAAHGGRLRRGRGACAPFRMPRGSVARGSPRVPCVGQGAPRSARRGSPSAVASSLGSISVSRPPICPLGCLRFWRHGAPAGRSCKVAALPPFVLRPRCISGIYRGFLLPQAQTARRAKGVAR